MEALDLASAFDAKGVPLHVVDSFPAGIGDDKREAILGSIIDSYIGITSDNFAISDLGTLVMRTRPGQPAPDLSSSPKLPRIGQGFFCGRSQRHHPPTEILCLARACC